MQRAGRYDAKEDRERSTTEVRRNTGDRGVDEQDRSPVTVKGKDVLSIVPRGLRASRFNVGVEDMMVLSYTFEPQTGALHILTEAERDVANRLTTGVSSKEIAEARGTSVCTVANQISSLYRKLGVGSRTELVQVLTEPAFESIEE